MIPPPAIIMGFFDALICFETSSIRPASGLGRLTCHSRSARNSSGTSMTSAWTSSGTAIVTAPVSEGSVSTRIAFNSAEKICSGRFTRSKKRESGLNASLTVSVKS